MSLDQVKLTGIVLLLKYLTAFLTSVVDIEPSSEPS